jgi:protein-disulfide isomerase
VTRRTLTPICLIRLETYVICFEPCAACASAAATEPDEDRPAVTDRATLPSRRRMLQLTAGAAALGLAAAWGLAWPVPALAQRRKAGPSEVPTEELMKQGPLPELVLGKEDAPITVVEYASMTCGHCANFHNKVFPALKEKYIDTGKVRFVMREFPLDNLAAGASMLARCAGGDKTFPLIGALFHTQENWAFVRGDPRPELFKVAKQAGFTQESFDKCLADQKLLDDISAVRTRAADQFGVNSTPTFFINGKKMTAGPSIEEFDKAFGEILKS